MVFPGCRRVKPVRDLTEKEIQVHSTCLQSYWFLHLPDVVNGFIFSRVGVGMVGRVHGGFPITYKYCYEIFCLKVQRI